MGPTMMMMRMRWDGMDCTLGRQVAGGGDGTGGGAYPHTSMGLPGGQEKESGKAVVAARADLYVADRPFSWSDAWGGSRQIGGEREVR